MDWQLPKGKTIDRIELLKAKTPDKETQNKTPLVLPYNHFLPKLGTLFESTGIYLILAEHFKDYSKKNRWQLLREIGTKSIRTNCK